MPVLKVLSTNSISGSGTEYQVVQTGYYRVIATAAASTVSFNGGPAITLVQNEAILLKSGAKPGQAKIAKVTNANPAVYTLGSSLGLTRDTHPFSADDFIAVEDNSTSPAINSGFLSAGTVGKKVASTTGNTITSDIDASGVGAAYTYGQSGNQAVVKRAVKITAGSGAIIVEEIQVVGG